MDIQEIVINHLSNQNLLAKKNEQEITQNNLLPQNENNERLFQCCRKGDAHFIPALIQAGASVQDTDKNGMTPLLLSALHGHTMCAQELVAAGADIEDRDKGHNTPLILCALRGWTSCARLLLMSGADPNAFNLEGDTPLIVASRSSASHDVVRLLVRSKGVDLDHSNKKGYTSLMIAIEAANLHTIKLLIDAGARLKEQTITSSNNNSKTCWQWKNVAERKGILKLVTLFHLHKVTGKSPLLIAALKGDLNSVQAILTMEYSILSETSESFGAIIIHYLRSFDEKKKIVSTIDITILKEMLRCTKWVALTLQDQGKVMELAVSIGNLSILKVLAEHNFSISCANFSIASFTPGVLEFLFEKFESDDKSQVSNLLQAALQCEQLDNAKILLKHGATLDIEVALKNAVEHTHMKALEFIVNTYKQEAQRIIKNSELFFMAVAISSLEVITFLLDCGVDVNKKFNGSYPPLFLAQDHHVVDLLLSRGADPNIEVNSETYTHPLLFLVSKDFKSVFGKLYEDSPTIDESILNSETVEIVKSLLRHGGRVDVKNTGGQTALHVASERGNSADIIKVLIEAGENVNETENTGRTALHVAVISQHIENIPCLIDAGVDLEITNSNGHTALFETRDPRTLELLLQGGADVNAVAGVIGNTLLQQALNDDLDVPEYYNILIRAGIDINHRNARGDWALMAAAQHFDIDTLKLLVTSGADVNMSTQNTKNETVITTLIQSLFVRFHEAKECISFCLEHGADVSTLHPCVIHALISSGCLSLVSKFISFGLAPVHLTIYKKSNAWYKPDFTRSISPLMTALLLNQADLAQYFTNIKYLMRSDISVLSGNAHFQEHLESKGNTESLEFLKKISLQPLSLETLSFIVISDTLGSGQDRRSKVEKLRVPHLIHDVLMFKNVAEDFINDSTRRNGFLYSHSLKRYDPDEDDEDDDDELDDEVEYAGEDEENDTDDDQ